jgi:hypothetical protein
MALSITLEVEIGATKFDPHSAPAMNVVLHLPQSRYFCTSCEYHGLPTPVTCPPARATALSTAEDSIAPMRP